MRTIGLAGAVMAGLCCAVACRADELPGQLKPCVSIHSDTERLACFDRAIAQIQSGQRPVESSNATVTAAERTPVDPATKDPDQISAAVTSRRRSADGMLILTLANSQVWRQQDGETSLTIDEGDVVTVVRGSLGTFRIADKRGHSARFSRLR